VIVVLDVSAVMQILFKDQKMEKFGQALQNNIVLAPKRINPAVSLCAVPDPL
jgi:hypothetical protein